MKPTLRGNRDLIRSINRSILLNGIKTQGQVSRVELARMTGLSPATVTAITGQLIQEGLIIEKATGDSTGGRPPIMLAINPRGGFVIGIKLMEGHAVGALTDLNATILAKDVISLADKQVETSVEALVALVNRLIHSGGIRKKQLMGVGIGLAGMVDFQNGIVKQNPFFGWWNVELGDLIKTRTRVPVFIDNDVNTLSLSEKWLNKTPHEDNFIIVTVGRGIGMGIVINGQIYRGKGAAGEFGHITVDPNGPLCDCGRRGCLESYVSDRALLETACREVSPEITDIEGLIQRVDAGDAKAAEVLTRAGTLLGMQIANLANVLDPKLIIISGEGVRLGQVFLTAVRSAFHHYVIPSLAKDTEIRVNTWGDDIWALGAASLVIAEIFKSPVQKEARTEDST